MGFLNFLGISWVLGVGFLDFLGFGTDFLGLVGFVDLVWCFLFPFEDFSGILASSVGPEQEKTLWAVRCLGRLSKSLREGVFLFLWCSSFTKSSKL